MFKAGDVVLGSFATLEGKILNHYSLVLLGNLEGALLVYTTSLKERSSAAQVFTPEDMRLANWTKPCRWDASCASLVPNNVIRKVGTISKITLAKVMKSYQSAAQQRTLSVAALSPSNEVAPA
jgi:hypothetical protein